MNATATHAETSSITVLEAERQLRGLNYKELGEALNTSEVSAWRYCTPREHDNHRQPSRKPLEGHDDAPAEKLRTWSGGKIHTGNYADPAPPPLLRRLERELKRRARQ